VNDSQRFLLEHFDTIHNSPTQIYHSALPLSPPSSWLCKYYAAEFSEEVKVVKGLPDGWGTCSRTVRLISELGALACRRDTLAVGLESGDIIFLNVITGSQVAVLSGHTNKVKSLDFFPDGTSLVSGSYDKTVKLWDVQTGGVVKTFCGHTDTVNSVSISSNCTTIASGSGDQTIHLWDIPTGECHCVIEGQGMGACAVFSPTNPQHLLCASGHFAWMWDINGHQVGPRYEGTCPAFSPDGTHFILCQKDVSTIRNSDSRVAVATCRVPSYRPRHGPFPLIGNTCFSPDGRLVATTFQFDICVWDITGSDPLLVETFIEDTDHSFSLVFSSSSTLISASYGRPVKFWQIGGLSTSLVADDPMSTPPTSTRIRSVYLLAENGIAVSSDNSGVVRTWDLSTGLCKGSFQVPDVYFSHRDAKMIDGRLIFVWNGHYGICIWDADEGKSLQIVGSGFRSSSGLRISGDGSKFFCIIWDSLQAWSIQTGEAVGEVEVRGNLLQKCLHVDGSRVWVSFEDKPTQGWDFGVSGSSPVPLSNLSLEKPCLSLILSVYGGRTHGPAWIEDTGTGKKVFQLSGRYAEPADAQWDGRYLVAGYGNGEVLILDFCDVHPQ
jgi:WD40 repeat protein